MSAVRGATEGIAEQRSASRELFPRRGASFGTNSTRAGGGDQAHGDCSERPVNDPAYRPSSSAARAQQGMKVGLPGSVVTQSGSANGLKIHTALPAQHQNITKPGLDQTSPKNHSARKGSPDGVMHEVTAVE